MTKGQTTALFVVTGVALAYALLISVEKTATIEAQQQTIFEKDNALRQAKADKARAESERNELAQQLRAVTAAKPAA